MKNILISFLLVALSALPSVAQTLQGVILLNDSTPCPYATVYVASANRGIAANEKGEYMLDELPAGNLKVEYSCMGQQTVRRELELSKGQTTIHNEMLAEKLMLLPPSIVTPDGEDPAHYVLRHVWDQADKNRKRIDTWQARVKYDFSMQDVDLFIKVIPKKYLRIMKMAAAVVGYRKIFNLFLDHPALKAKVSLLRTYAKGKVKDSEQKVLYSSDQLTADEQKTLSNNKLLVEPNLFDEIYDDSSDWGRKGENRDKFKLTGSYEQDGQTIDVLEYVSTTTREVNKVNEQGDTIKVKKTRVTTTTVHVVEEVWGILKVEKRSDRAHSLSECRDLEGGIYMPISSSNHISVPLMKAEEIPAKIAEAEKLDMSEYSKLERQVSEAFIEQLKQHQGRDICLDLSFNYDIDYRYFKLK